MYRCSFITIISDLPKQKHKKQQKHQQKKHKKQQHKHAKKTPKKPRIFYIPVRALDC